VLLIAPACAPRVSKRVFKAPVAEQAQVMKPIEQPVQKDSTPPPVVVAMKQEPAMTEKAVEKKPEAQAVEETPPVAPQPVEEEEEQAAPQEPQQEEETAMASATTTDKKTFYSFSDNEIGSLRKKSREFKKLHNKLKSCTSRSERAIAKREQMRDRIIMLQNIELRTPKQDKELAKLRTDERKMLNGRAEGIKDCHDLEGRLTEMLIVAYGTSAS
jgi:hypothetical protein